MGYFTWTDAIRTPRVKKDGEYFSRDVVSYGRPAKIVLPDDSEIKTSYYDGYGMFGKEDEVDAYDVVVDWNRDYLPEIFNRLKTENPGGFWGQELANLAAFYAEGMEKEMDAEIERLKSSHYLHVTSDGWKRLIGIAISCDGDNNAKLPFPLKITACRDKVKYTDLYPSMSTQ